MTKHDFEPRRVGERAAEQRHTAEHDHESNEPFRREAPKVGRNDPCSCGSGKKFKKCCGAK